MLILSHNGVNKWKMYLREIVCEYNIKLNTNRTFSFILPQEANSVKVHYNFTVDYLLNKVKNVEIHNCVMYFIVHGLT